MQACISGIEACDNPRSSQVDLLYLHNVAEMQPDAVATPPFHKKLAAAFKFLEQKRQQGQIQAYGMATWTCFRSQPEAPGFLALQKVVALAEEIGGKDHGFRHAPGMWPKTLGVHSAVWISSVQAACSVVLLAQVHPAAHQRWHDGGSAEALAARHLRGGDEAVHAPASSCRARRRCVCLWAARGRQPADRQRRPGQSGALLMRQHSVLSLTVAVTPVFGGRQSWSGRGS